MPLAGRSKVPVCGRSLAGIVGSNPAGVLDVCLLWRLCVVRLSSPRRDHNSSRGVLPIVARLCFISKPKYWGSLGQLGPSSHGVTLERKINIWKIKCKFRCQNTPPTCGKFQRHIIVVMSWLSNIFWKRENLMHPFHYSTLDAQTGIRMQWGHDEVLTFMVLFLLWSPGLWQW